MLDLFCGAGGCSVGYHRAGFDVVGVDLHPQPNYPFEFHQGDSLDFLEYRRDFDFIHASPPCQAYTALRSMCGDKEYPDLVADTRTMLINTGIPYVIENVMSAPLIGGIRLCGGMFGLRTYRHRRFESSELLSEPNHPRHVIRTATKNRRASWDAGMHVSITGDVGTYLGLAAMGIDWMNGNELCQAIPPAYTEFIGKQLLRSLCVTS